MVFLRKKILIIFIISYITMNKEKLKYLLKWEKWDFLRPFGTFFPQNRKKWEKFIKLVKLIISKKYLNSRTQYR